MAGIDGAVIAAGLSKAVGGFLIGQMAKRIFSPTAAGADYTRDVKGLSATAEIDTPQSNYGYPIPIPYGSCRLNTNLIWATPFRRQKIQEEVIIDQYNTRYDRPIDGNEDNQIAVTVDVSRDFVDFAVLVSAGKIGGIKRIWFNHQLIFDADKWGDSRPFFNGQQLNIEIYLGSDTQSQSPTIVAAESGERAPAYRGRAYIVFKNLDITIIGGSLPVVQVEVVGIDSGYQVSKFTDYTPRQVVRDMITGEKFKSWRYEQHTTVTDSIRDDGSIVPLPFASIDISQHGFIYAEDILVRAGLPQKYFNVSQLGQKITGLVIQDAGPIRPFIETIARYCNSVISESDGCLTFQTNPRLPKLPQYEKNCLISDIGLTVNSLHDVDGRDGYFSSSGGTSEGQFVSIWAFCLAYRATGNEYWRDRALFLAGALENYLYGRAVPTAPGMFIPHWLYNVKRPFQEESSILAKSLPAADHGSYLQAFIPSEFYADKIKRIDRAYRKSAGYIWDNREADLINFSYLGVKRNTHIATFTFEIKDSGLYGFSSDEILKRAEFVTYQSYSKRAQLQTAELEIIDIARDSAGWTVKLSKPADYTLEVDDEIILSYTLIEHGEIINVGDKYEAWPHWRKLARGEIDAAGDSLYWANDAYKELYGMTSDIKWLNAYNANKYTIQKSHDIDDARQILKPYPGVNTPYNQPGTFSRSERYNFGKNSWKRRVGDGVIYARIPTGVGEIQLGRGVNDTWRSPTDTFLVRLRRAPIDNNLIIDNSETPAPDTYALSDDTYVWIDTDLVFSETTRYYAKIPLTENTSVNDYFFMLSDFITKFDSLDPEKQLTSGSPIRAAGISIFENSIHNLFFPSAVDRPIHFEIHLMRPLPEIELPYTPYAAMYTVNVLENNLINWRGVPGSGYTYPHVWNEMGVPAGMIVQLSFLKEAQNQYKMHFNATHNGPFIPAFYWDREDARKYGAPGTWGWLWVDPNSQWGGYQYRALQSVCEAARATANADAVLIAANYLTWINTVWTTHTKFPPTDFPEIMPVWSPNTQFNTGFYNAKIDITRPNTANGFVYKPLNTGVSGATEPIWPTALYQTVIDGGITWECSGHQYENAYGNYNEPHMCALIMRAAIYGYLAGINPSVITGPLIVRCYNYLETNFIVSGDFKGAWSDNGDWWMFWHAEIIGTLSILHLNPAIVSALGLNIETINTWLAESNNFIARNTRSA